MTKEELLALGTEMDLDLKSAMRKQDIVKTIHRSRNDLHHKNDAHRGGIPLLIWLDQEAVSWRWALP